MMSAQVQGISREELEQLAATPDILTVGMMADDARRAAAGREVTYVRVAVFDLDGPAIGSVPAAAREVRLNGRPASLSAALDAVRAAKRVAGERPLSAFSLADLVEAAGTDIASWLRELRAAGLETIADAPLDRLAAAETALEACEAAGFDRLRLTVDRASAADRLDLVLRARDLKSRFAAVVAVSPLPMVLNAFRPTTGYDDVKMVALTRLAVPGVRVQVDWRRYGPKLAQVALTFGADDIDNVPADDDAPDGTRRSPLAELRRNIEAAGFEPVERDGRFG
jgi:phosphoglycolate phosphatase-like HAD superfamily hydrolase